MGKSEHRRRLFELYSANLGLFMPQHTGLFACPICSSLFDASSVRGESLGVDLAHAYPETCGGRVVTLTCAACNSRIGSRYDSHLAIEHHLWDAFGGSGRRPIDVRVHYPWGNIGATAVFTEGRGYHFTAIKKQTDPKVCERTVAVLVGHDGNSELTFKIAAPAYNPAHLTTALFHAAYLNLFRHFGYEYILYCDTEWIRALLTAQRPRADIKICTLEVPREEGAELAAVAHSVGMLQTTAGLRTLVVALPHPDPKFVLRIISLPGFGQEGLAQYRALTERIDHYAQSQFVFLRDDPKGRLGHRCGMLGRSFWQRAFNPHDG